MLDPYWLRDCLIAVDVCAGCPCTASCAAARHPAPGTSWGVVWAGRWVDLPDLTTRKDPSLSAPVRHPSTRGAA